MVEGKGRGVLRGAQREGVFRRVGGLHVQRPAGGVVPRKGAALRCAATRVRVCLFLARGKVAVNVSFVYAARQTQRATDARVAGEKIYICSVGIALSNCQ